MQEHLAKCKGWFSSTRKKFLQVLLAVTLIPYLSSLVILLSGVYAEVPMKVICGILSGVVFIIMVIYIITYVVLSKEDKVVLEETKDVVKTGLTGLLSIVGFIAVMINFVAAISAMLSASLSGLPLFIVIAMCVLCVSGVVGLVIMFLSWLIVEGVFLILNGCGTLYRLTVSLFQKKEKPIEISATS